MLYPQSSMIIATRGGPDADGLGVTLGETDAEGDGGAAGTVAATDGSSLGATATCRAGARCGVKNAMILCRCHHAPARITAKTNSTKKRRPVPPLRRRDRDGLRLLGVTD